MHNGPVLVKSRGQSNGIGNVQWTNGPHLLVVVVVVRIPIPDHADSTRKICDSPVHGDASSSSHDVVDDVVVVVAALVGDATGKEGLDAQ